MPGFSSTPFAFPEFRGATRRLVLWNLGAYFLLQLALVAVPDSAYIIASFPFTPSVFLRGDLWQPLTYSLVHPTLLGTLFELLSLWFIAGFLETYHKPGWVTGLYAVSVFGTATAATAIYVCSHALGISAAGNPLTGCFGGIFGLLVAIGTLHGDVQFMLFPLPIGIKARHLAAIFALVAIASLFFGDQRMYAFAELGGGLAGLGYISLAPRRGLSLGLSEQWYGLRNGYYRWKRRRAGRKFEVYMRSQGRTGRFDSKGRPIDEDPNDKSRWN
jgi:membrane associated rhomboid family serine protease